ncbi:MAG: diacylglycerol kinase family protein [Bacteroidales bacterium]|nr:diacylglycerol kinase family protein [Bacteroidales bacterium]
MRLRSFADALRGIVLLVVREPHARIHLLAAVLVIAAGIVFKLSAWEWVAAIFAIGLVFAAEAFNTAIERLCDVVQPARDARIRDIKDLSAGAVLLCALTAAAIGLILFLPKLLALIDKCLEAV